MLFISLVFSVKSLRNRGKHFVQMNVKGVNMRLSANNEDFEYKYRQNFSMHYLTRMG